MNTIEEKKYLRWYNIVGYGSGDVAGNVVYAFLTAFTMIYLTDTAGMNAGVVGTLILASKLFDGLTDLGFGTLIDRTRSKMGKARPWMFWGYFGVALTLVACFAIPSNFSLTAQYAWFFVAYTLLNSVFYTANNIAYSALTALVTRNPAERVQMGSVRFMFAFGTSMVIQAITVKAVDVFGSGAQGWQTVAIIYAVIGLLVNSISVFSVKELPESELEDDPSHGSVNTDKVTFFESLKLLSRNRFYLLLLGYLINNQILNTMLGMGIYYYRYILHDINLVAPFSLAGNIPLIVGLVIVSYLVKRDLSLYRMNMGGYAITVVARFGLVWAGYMGNIPLMLAFTALAQFGASPMQGSFNALTAEASEYTWLKDKRRIDGAMFSCTSLGIKVGSGIATGITGWMLNASGYVANADIQPDSAVSMLNALFLWIPAFLAIVNLIILWAMPIQRTNEALREKLALEAESQLV